MRQSKPLPEEQSSDSNPHLLIFLKTRCGSREMLLSPRDLEVTRIVPWHEAYSYKDEHIVLTVNMPCDV